jgi:hypothetical protein
MTWRQVLRSMEASARRQRRQYERERRVSERDALRHHRELERRRREAEKAEAAEQAAAEAASFESYLSLIVSVHKDCGEEWDWKLLAEAPAPSPPSPRCDEEDSARRALEAYQPGFFERLFRTDRKRRAALEAKVVEARQKDLHAHDIATEQFRASYEFWQKQRTLAGRVLNRDTSAYRDALDHAEPFDELESFKTKVSISDLQGDAAALSCEITDSEVIPSEEVKLTAGGKLSTKAMAAGRYWLLYQDYVCSCAIRAARETLAVLPVARAVVNVGTVTLDTSTGHRGLVTLLSAGFAREALQRLNLSAIDPSDAMKNFPHRMKFKKTSGFDPVDPIALDEGWVSTG